MREHPSGRPVRKDVVKTRPRPIGTYMEPVVARLATPTTQLAGGAGFPINPSYDEYWELRSKPSGHRS